MSAPMDRAGVVRVMADAAWSDCTALGYCDRTETPCECEQVMMRSLAAIEAAGLRVVPVEVLHRLEKLAKLGNGERYGNSFGNEIAQAALRAASPFAPPPKETQE